MDPSSQETNGKEQQAMHTHKNKTREFLTTIS
jgi:hypothetical protein